MSFILFRSIWFIPVIIASVTGKTKQQYYLYTADENLKTLLGKNMKEFLFCLVRTFNDNMPNEFFLLIN